MRDIEGIERELQEAVESLSPPAREAWARIERIVEEEGLTEQSADKAAGIIDESPPSDQDDLGKALVVRLRLHDARVAQQREERDSFRWMANRMQEEGLQQGLNKEQRSKVTLGELLGEPPKGRRG